MSARMDMLMGKKKRGEQEHQSSDNCRTEQSSDAMMKQVAWYRTKTIDQQSLRRVQA